MTSRPNILFFITDQLRADHLGCYGNRTVRTPAIDSIAARGVAFDRFYVASPVCQPNRATLATGRMPSLHGVRTNGISLSLAANTFIEMLRASGWQTALIGKSHLQNFTGMPPVAEGAADAARAIRRRRKATTRPRRRIAAIRSTTRRAAANGRAIPAHALRLPYYGFDHVELCSGHATQVHGNYTSGCASGAPTATRCAGRRIQLPHDYVLPQAWRTALPEELYPTSYVVERTLAWLDGFAQAQGRRAVLPAMLVSRSASSVHAAGPLLGHVQAGRHDAAGHASASATGRSRRMSPRCMRRATAAPASPTRRRPSR